MELLVSEDVARQLGRPTVESLRTRLTPHAPCLECGEPLGSEPIAVIGQQHQNKALVVGAHSTCRPSEWIRFEEAETLTVPVAGDATVAVEFSLGPGGWRRRVARFLGAQTSVPALLVFPFLGCAWVELVGPGEAINDDLSFYRDELGLTSEGEVRKLTEARAWINPEGRLFATIKGHEFATHVPVGDRLAATIRQAGFIHLLVVSGVEIGAKGSVSRHDLYTALEDGRLLSGEVAFGPSPESSEERTRSDGRKSTGLLVDERTRAELGDRGLDEVASALWPIDCQTCGQPLGDDPPSLLVQDLDVFASAGLHHQACQQPAWLDRGLMVSPPTDAPTVSFVTRLAVIPLLEVGDCPLMVVNPGMELVLLERDPGGHWRVIIAAEFVDAGLRPPGESLDVGAQAAIPDARAELRRDSVTITLPPPTGRSFTAPLAGESAGGIAEQIRDRGGLLLGVTHVLNPERLTEPAELEPVMRAGRIALGWIQLSK